MTPAPDPTTPRTARLRVLATSDLHMNLTGFDYAAHRPDPDRGMARVATLIKRARDEADKMGALCLLFDNGDALQGNPMDEAVLDRPGPHPLMRVFGQLGYDAIGLGNHDFDFGLDVLLRIVADAPCPVLASNLFATAQEPPGPVQPHAILDRQMPDAPLLRIGALSFLPPQTMLWNAHHLADKVRVGDILITARDRVRALRRAGCDIVIGLAHSGVGSTPCQPGAENVAGALAGLDGIDAVIAGHTHDTVPGPSTPQHQGGSDGAPMVMPGSLGSHLGVIDLDLVLAEGRWRVARGQAALHAVTAETEANPDLLRLTAEDDAHTRAYWNRSAGRTDTHLHSYFSFCAPDRSLALVAAAQAAALRPYLADSAFRGLPVLSATAPCKFGARSGPRSFTDVPEGAVLWRHVADLYAFANDLSGVILTGAEIRDWLEHSARMFNRVAPGDRRAPLLARDVPGHDFDVIHGLTYRIDLTRPATAGRVRDLCLDGVPVAPDQRFAVALNSYRASGAGGFPHVADAPNLDLPRLKVRDVLVRYLSGEIAPDPLEQAPPPWRFAEVPDASVTLETGPGALFHLHEIADRLLETEGPDKAGFLRLHLALSEWARRIANLPGSDYIDG